MAMGPEEKKKAYLLGGLAGVLGIVGLGVLQPWAGSRNTADTETAAANTALTGPGASSADPTITGAGAGEGSAAAAPAAASANGAGAVASPQFVANEDFRDDPFVPKYTKVLPVPPPPPPPPRPTPVPTPLPPVVLPSTAVFARENPLGRDRSDLPAFPGGNTRSTVLQGLPQARVSRLVNAPTAPRVQSAPVGPSGNAPVLERATNKRLAGVAIGDSVRALLEVQDAATGEFRTYIVQPGQRIDAENLQVLRIERTTEGGQSRVRMIVRENGETRIVELREGARPDLAGAGGGGSGEGYPGSGGYPGAYFGGSSSGSSSSSSGGFRGAPGGFSGGFPSAAAPPGFPGGRPGFGGSSSP